MNVFMDKFLRKIFTQSSSEQGNTALFLIAALLVVLVVIYFLMSGREVPSTSSNESDGISKEISSSPAEVETIASPSPTQEIPADEQSKEEQIPKEEAVAAARPVKGTVVRDAVVAATATGTIADAVALDEARLAAGEPIHPFEEVHAPISTPPATEIEAAERFPEDNSPPPENYKPQEHSPFGQTARNTPVAYATTITDQKDGVPAGGPTPPDTHGAVGPDHLFAVSNGNFRITPRDGSAVTTVSLESFFGGIGASGLFDPRVVYDPNTARFYVTAVSNRRSNSSSIVLAVSASSSAADTWHKWRFDHDSSNINWADFPSLGMSSDKITISVNSFSNAGDNFNGIHIVLVDKASALDGGSIISKSIITNGVGGTHVPAETYDTNMPTQYFAKVGTSNLFGTGRIQLYKITGTINSPTYSALPGGALGSPWSLSLPNAPQLGTSSKIETNDDRILSSVVRNGRLWAVHTVARPVIATTKFHVIKWWEANISTGQMIQEGHVQDYKTDLAEQLHFYFPSIAVNENNDVLIGFSGSSSQTYVGTYYTMRRASDPLGYTDPPTLIKAGLGAYTGPRWGDYSATVVDPTDSNKFWTIQEYATASNKGATWWGQIEAGPSDGDVIPPIVVNAKSLDSSTVRVVFNEAMLNNDSLRNPANYTFTSTGVTAGIPISATAVSVESGTTVNLTVTPMTNGSTYYVYVAPSDASGSVSDLVGNPLYALENSANFVGLSTALTVTLSSTASNPTNQSTIPVTATFSASVTEFDSNDLTPVNGSINSFNGSGKTYTFNLVPASQGTVSVSIPAGAGTDGEGKTNGSGAQLSRTYDSVAPVGVITSTASNPTNLSPIPVSVSFVEAVTGFAAGDLQATNATVSNFQSQSALNYSFNLNPTAQGAVTVTLPNNKVTDTAGNSNTASTPLARTYDTANADVTLTTTAGAYSNTSTIAYTATFAKTVTGFVSEDVAVSNGSVTAFSGIGSNYSFSVTPSGQGAVSVTIPAAVAVDTAGNPNNASGEVIVIHDTVKPTPSISSTASNPTNVSPIPVSLSFAEAVSGLDVGDFSVSNGSIVNFQVESSQNYSFSVTPLTEGVVTVSLPANLVTDAAGNTNEASSVLSRTYDSSSAITTLSSAVGSNTNASPINFSVTFSKSVDGFTGPDVLITNGSIASFSGGGSSYSFAVTPAAEGMVRVSIPAGAGTDTNGNPTTASGEVVTVYDSVKPTVQFSSVASNPTNQSPIAVTATFSEIITGFEAADLSPTNGTISNFQVITGDQYSFSITPTANGTVSVSLPAGRVADTAGNTNTASAVFSRTFETGNVVTTLTSAAGTYTASSPITYSVTFGRVVTGFTSLDVAVTNGSVSAFSGGDAVYSFSVIPAGQGMVRVSIPQGVAQDSSSNPNGASAEMVTTYDSLVPSASITSTTSNPTNSNAILVQVTLSEPVQAFSANSLLLLNATMNNFNGSGLNYSFTLVPQNQGTVQVEIPSNALTDFAGNKNTINPKLLRTYDSIPPSPPATVSVGQ